MKNNLSGIELLGREESMAVVGGGPTPAQLVASLTANIFTLTGGLTNSSPLYTQFVTELTDLAGTAVGYDMLNQILNAGLKIQLSGVTPDGAQALYDPTTTNGVVTNRIMDIGGLSITTSTSNFDAQASDFGIVAHELFHAYMDVVEGLVPTPYWKSSQVEIDAFLFQYMACAQMDQNDKIAPNDFENSYTVFSVNLSTESEQAANAGNSGALAFFNAWQNMFQSGQFTLTNYNALITNFHAADINNGYTALTTTAETQAAFTSSAIETFFTKDYSPNSGSFKPLFDPLNNTKAASSGGTDGNPGVGIVITPNGGVVYSSGSSTTYLAGVAPSGNTSTGSSTNAGVTETYTGATAVGAVHASTPVVNSDGTVTWQIVDSQGTVIGTVTVTPQVSPPTSSLQDPTTPSGVAYTSSSSDDGDDGGSGSSTDTSYDV